MADHDENTEVIVNLDIGNLCVNSIALLKTSLQRDPSEETLRHVAALGAQKLLTEIFKLPCEYHEHVPVVKLPEPSIIIPREKPVPKPKAMTKWEKFAKEKGINKKKKDKTVWDEQSKDWKPRYGYRSIQNKDDWLIEIPENGDPNKDYFGVKKEEKKERVAKNEYQRLRNIAVAAKMKVTNMESVDHADKNQLSRSLTAAKTATASVGRFTNKLPKEKPAKNPKKRKFQPNTVSTQSMKNERENSLKIFENLDKKKPKLDVNEAVQRYVIKGVKEGQTEEIQQNKQRKQKSKKNKFVKNLFRSGKKKKPFRRN